jgi:hypothetical protein
MDDDIPFLGYAAGNLAAERGLQTLLSPKIFSLLAAGIPEPNCVSSMCGRWCSKARSCVLNRIWVLAYNKAPGAEPLVPNLTSIIAIASQRGDLTPVYSFNKEGTSTGAANGDGSRYAPVALEDLLVRAAKEGF